MFDEFLAEVGVSKEHLLTSAAVAVCWVVLYAAIKAVRPAGRATTALARRTARLFKRPPPPPYEPSALAAALLDKLAAPGWKAYPTEEGAVFLDYRLDGSAVRRVTVKACGSGDYCIAKIDDGPDQVTHAYMSAADCREVTRVARALVKRVREEATLAALGATQKQRDQAQNSLKAMVDAVAAHLGVSQVEVKQATAPRPTTESVIAELPGFTASDEHIAAARIVPPAWFGIWQRLDSKTLTFFGSRMSMASAHAVVCTALVSADTVFVIAPGGVLPGSPAFRYPAVSVYMRPQG